MVNNSHKEFFDLSFKLFEKLQNLSAKYEAKTGVSINCINCSVAIWAIATAILFTPPVLPLVLVIVYIILSVVSIAVAVLGWEKGFSATGFKTYDSFSLDLNVKERFFESEEKQDIIYEDINEILLKGIQDMDKTLESRKQSVKSANYLSITALSLSIFLVMLIIIGKTNEIYNSNKPQIYIAEYNCSKNSNNIGAVYENNESKWESAKQSDSSEPTAVKNIAIPTNKNLDSSFSKTGR